MVFYTICRTPAQARYLPLRYAQKKLRGKAFSGEDVVPEELEPGQERLYSYYEPPLAAGPHLISTYQQVKQDGEKDLLLEGSQQFNVKAPRYTLPDGSIHSIYPPQGHAEHIEILPHVVLNDPYLPWTRKVKDVVDFAKERNRVPWLALLVFTQEELRVPSTENLLLKQSNTLSVNLSLAELCKLGYSTPVLKASGSPWDGENSDTRADFILVPKALFRALFGSNEGDQPKNYDVSAYQWLAHMRHINTVGMANSGIDGEKGSFGVVLSHRTGPLDITEPTDLVVHLVSIEKIPSLTYPVTTDRVALCSLDSWTYTCLPPKSFNVYDGFRELGKDLKVLRIDAGLMEKGLEAGTVLPSRLKDRLKDGYTMTRYRTQTGEETAAWTRGPLVPTIVTHETGRAASHSGTDLQVLDRVTGIMDVTYSAAWQLGKTLAISDQGFATALGRLRIVISRTATDEAKKAILKQAGVFQDRRETLRGLASSLSTLSGLDPKGLLSGPDGRWRSSSSDSFDLSHSGPLMQHHFSDRLGSTVKHLTSSITKGEAYNEINAPLSPDWMVVFSWIMDRMYMSGIPAHYLLPDPAYLPAESLRFFHVDRNWIDAFVDGALSIANHLTNDDMIPVELKKAINRYLETKPEGLTYPPGFGFLLRSELCVKFPDLIVEAYRGKDETPDPTLILRQENIAEGLLLVMFAEEPGGKVLQKLILREPPHQQAFSAGTTLKPEFLQVAYKKIFTIPLAEQEKLQHRTTPVLTVKHFSDGTFVEEQTGKQGTADPIYVWDHEGVNLHSIRPSSFAKQVHRVLTENQEMKDGYTETGSTATLMGIQLNHPMYYLEISLKSSKMFPTLSHLTGDDGVLTGLQMINPPKRVRRRNEVMAKFMHYAQPQTRIDWHASFVAFPEIPDNQHPGISTSALLPAPHVRRAARATDLMPRLYDFDSNGITLMEYSVFPLTDRPSKDTISMLRYKQDIVFSLHRGGTGGGFTLRSISISIPLGNPTKARPSLMDQYDGVEATMVSNFRFNAAPVESQNGQDLVVTVVPRAKKATMSSAKNKNLSFMLTGVMVADYSGSKDWITGSKVPVYLSVSEHYEGSDTLHTHHKIELKV